MVNTSRAMTYVPSSSVDRGGMVGVAAWGGLLIVGMKSQAYLAHGNN